MTEARPQISVVSPVYGCRDCLQRLADAVRDGFEGTGLTWELILVDDRAPDDPWDLIVDLAASDSRIRGIRLASNHGQHLAIWAGLEAARGAWVAVVDCDLQDDPTVIPDLYAEALEKNVHAVIVERGTWSDSAFRRIMSRGFFRVIETLAGLELRNIGNFGLYSRRMVDALLQFREKQVFLPMMVILTGLSRSFYTLDRADRAAGRSSYTLKRLIQMAVSIIVRFSDRPLKASVLVGTFFSSMAVLVSIYLLIAWSLGAFTVPGWTSVILSVWFLAGLILAVLGVHGIYLGQVFSEVRDRPRIIVEDETENAAEPALSLRQSQT